MLLPAVTRPVVLAAVLLLGSAVPALGDDSDPILTMRHAHARRLADFGGTAKDARLGSLALRAFQEALSLDPEQDAARLALGWKREGASWTPPDPRTLVAYGWPDDGEADLPRLAKREAALSAEWVSDLARAAATMKAKGAPAAAVERVLWGAIAADPRDPAARRALGHVEDAGRWLAPDTRAVLASAAADATADAAFRTLAVPLGRAEPHAATIPGWTKAVPAGASTPSAGNAYSLTDPARAGEIATALERAKRFLDDLLTDPKGASALPIPATAILHVGARDVADALFDADPSIDAATKAALRFRASYPLGSTGYTLVVGESPAAALDASVGHLAEQAVAADGARAELSWLGQALHFVTTRRVLGTYLGYGATARAFAGDSAPPLRPREPIESYLRRLVVLGADASIEEIAANATATRRPRDAAKAGALLEWLFHRDRAKARAFVGTCVSAGRGAGEGAARLAQAARAAGFDSVAALDEAWRRFALDAYAEVGVAAPTKDTWKIAKLEAPKAEPLAISLYVPATSPVTGSLWFAGRPWTCEVVEDGAAVKLYPVSARGAPRIVRQAGTYPFKVPGEYNLGWIDVRVALSNDGGVWDVRSAEAFAGTIENTTLTFLDLDLDGRFGGFDRDGYVVGSGAHVLPLRREIVLGGKSIEIRRVGPDGREIAWRSRPLLAKGRDLEAMLRLNAWRVASGVPGLSWDAEGSVGASLHADYLATAFPGGVPAGEERREDPAKKGATSAGQTTALAAVVAAGATPTAVIDHLIAGIRERASILDPDARRAATGAATSIGVVALSAPDPSEPPSEFRGPVVFPPPDGEGLPTRLSAESQARLSMLPDAGLPISLQFRRGEPLDALSIEVALSTAAGARLDLVRLDPIAHAAALEGTSGMAVFVPKAPLAKGTSYRLVATWARGSKVEQRTLSFRTASN